MNYNHTQKGKLMLVISFIIIVYFAYIWTIVGLNNLSMIIILGVLFVLASFTTLNVSINYEYLKIKFGYGIFKKKFLLKEIISVKKVTNPWYYGWGIKFRFNPKMWIFNVSGFDAVQITMKNGSVYRIGTDEPEDLEIAIKKIIK